MSDNPTTQEPLDNSGDPTGGQATGTETQTTTQEQGSPFSWKSQVGTDLRNSPLLQKFEDTPDGLNKAFESHHNLENLLGNEKVPIPKGPDDAEGWTRFSKAMGIPDRAEGYGLADVEIPNTMKGISFDKTRFAEIVHGLKATPEQAKGLWEAYTNMTKDSYAKAIQAHQDNMNQVINQLRGEWGDTYETNVELGQSVINQFAADKDMEQWLTATMTQNPYGIKFLAKIGNQFAENKIGDFQYKKFSLTAEDAQMEIDRIVNDPSHPYNNDKAVPKERERAISHVNGLYGIINKAKQ